MKNKKLTIFIPCFNEEKNIDRLVSEWDLATENSENIFILFIDNGSNDNTLGSLRRILYNTTFFEEVLSNVNDVV